MSRKPASSAVSPAERALAQVRALGHPTRLRLLTALIGAGEPRTVTQLADALELPVPKAHYHVRTLEKAGLVGLVEVRPKGGVLEKYYGPIQGDVRGGDLFGDSAVERARVIADLQRAVRARLRAIDRRFARLIQSEGVIQEPESATLRTVVLRVPAERLKDFAEWTASLPKVWKAEWDQPGGQPIEVTVAVLPGESKGEPKGAPNE